MPGSPIADSLHRLHEAAVDARDHGARLAADVLVNQAVQTLTWTADVAGHFMCYRHDPATGELVLYEMTPDEYAPIPTAAEGGGER